jgi:hypothetical protein
VEIEDERAAYARATAAATAVSRVVVPRGMFAWS